MVKKVHENNEFWLVTNFSETACWLVNTSLVKEEKTCNFSKSEKLVHAQGDGKVADNFGKQFFLHVLMCEINYRGHD